MPLSSEPSMDFMGFVQAVLIFAGVLVLSALAARLSAQRLRVRGKVLRVREAVPVGFQKQVVLLQVGDKALVLGVADKAISHLATLDIDDIAAALAAEENEASRESVQDAFSRILDRIRKTS